MFNEPYLLKSLGDLSLILWEQVSNVSHDVAFDINQEVFGSESKQCSCLYVKTELSYTMLSHQREVLHYTRGEGR